MVQGVDEADQRNLVGLQRHTNTQWAEFRKLVPICVRGSANVEDLGYRMQLVITRKRVALGAAALAPLLAVAFAFSVPDAGAGTDCFSDERMSRFGIRVDVADEARTADIVSEQMATAAVGTLVYKAGGARAGEARLGRVAETAQDSAPMLDGALVWMVEVLDSNRRPGGPQGAPELTATLECSVTLFDARTGEFVANLHSGSLAP